MNILRKLAVVIVALGSVSLAQADLIDQGNTTLDTDSGLVWLDVNVTNQQSYDSIYAAGGLAENGGWRHATSDEFNALISSVISIPFDTVVQNPTLGSFSDIVAIQLILGVTETSAFGLSGINRRLRGFLDSPNLDQDDFWLGYLSTHTSTITADGPFTALWWSRETTAGLNSTDGFTGIGHWLVQASPDPKPNPVPEPSTLALLGIGLVGMAVRRRKSLNE